MVIENLLRQADQSHRTLSGGARIRLGRRPSLPGRRRSAQASGHEASSVNPRKHHDGDNRHQADDQIIFGGWHAELLAEDHRGIRAMVTHHVPRLFNRPPWQHTDVLARKVGDCDASD